MTKPQEDIMENLHELISRAMTANEYDDKAFQQRTTQGEDMSETLAPCPFCGGNAELQWYAHPNVTRFYWVACTQCQADTPLQGIDTSNQEAVIEFWNRRAESADHAALVARVAELEAQLANQYKRIERFVELVDQLEAQLAAARRWEPLPDGEYDMGVENEPLYLFGNTDPDVCTHVEWQGDTVMLDLGMTVCRLTDAPGDMPDSVRATMREALAYHKAQTEKFVATVGRYGLASSEHANRVAAIDVARAYLDAQP